MNLNDRLREVELHIHLDGALRPETIYALGANRDFASLDQFRRAVELESPYSLTKFLEPFHTFNKYLKDNKVCF